MFKKKFCVFRIFNAQPVKIPQFKSRLARKHFYCIFLMFISSMLITPSFKKRLIVEQGNYLKLKNFRLSENCQRWLT